MNETKQDNNRFQLVSTLIAHRRDDSNEFMIDLVDRIKGITDSINDVDSRLRDFDEAVKSVLSAESYEQARKVVQDFCPDCLK